MLSTRYYFALDSTFSKAELTRSRPGQGQMLEAEDNLSRPKFWPQGQFTATFSFCLTGQFSTYFLKNWRLVIVNVIFRLRQTENSVLWPLISVCLRRKRKCYFPSDPDGHLEIMGYFLSVPCYDVILLNYPTQTPVLHSGSRLDRQWYSFRGYRPFTPPARPTK